MSEILSRGSRSLVMGMILLALTACQPIRPIQETTDGNAETQVATPTAEPETNTDVAQSPASQPASGDAQKAADLVSQGKEQFKISDLSGAEQSFKDAIEADPSNLDAHIGLADVYVYLPEYHQQALEAAQAAVDLNPESPEALARLSWAQSNIHKFEAAKATAEKAVELGPDSSIAHAALADILYAVYEVDAAYDEAKTATSLNDQDAGAWATLGSIAFGLENWDEAGTAYEKALDLEPDFFLWQILNARYLLDTEGDVDAAREIAQPAIDALPKHAYILSLLADLAVERNDWKAAEASCNDAIKLSTADTPYPDGYTCMVGLKLLQEDYTTAEKYQKEAESLAWPERRDITVFRMRLYNDKDRCDDGLKLAQAWLKERSFSVSALRMVGAGYLCKDDYEKAIDYFKQAVDKLPLSLADARLLANAYARDGKETEALGTLRKFSKISARNPLYYQAMYEVYLFLGKAKEAVKQAQRWQVLRPDNTDAKTSLALGFLFDNNPGAAQDSAQEALDAGAQDSTVYVVLGESYSRQGDLEKGEEFLKKALDINEDNFLAHNYLATLYLTNGDCENATEQLTWLKTKMTDKEQLAQIEELLTNCEQIVQGGRGQSGSESGSGSSNGGSDSSSGSGKNTPSSRDDAQAQAEKDAIASVRAFLRSQKDARVRTVRFEDSSDGLILVVVYTTRFDADSEEFADLEHQIAYGLSSLLPDMEAKPIAMGLLSSSNDKPQHRILIANESATRWMDGLLTNEEFENSWLVEDAGQ